MITIFLSFAQTSERTYIRGYLDSDVGVITVNSEARGIISQVGIEEGKHVKKGDTLFIISNPYREKTKVFIENLSQRVANLKREAQLKKEHYNALEKLNKKNYISKSTLKNTESELLEITNKIQSENLELIKYKQSQYQLVKSPVDGIVTNVFYKHGQIAEASKSLLQIIPDNSILVARLYVPSKDIGFLKKGAQVIIKYDAYPSQRFGFYKAFIKEINLTVLTDEKEDKPIQVGEPYYKIKAELETSYVNLYGKKENLSHGMTLTAVITGEKKKIWQWVFDPIYSYYGDTFS
ncbi:MAG: HlyD family efflux transporter periplasmic adaptor subunit [Legionella sp.]|nr:HlyD family efflux transporter periplasmic adaptor subunit [Legionella sp.]